jgi:glucosamine kinase
MILIADSGSTKTDWVFLSKENNKTTFFTSSGLNPNLLSDDAIRSELFHITEIETISASVNALYFYGAGLGNNQNVIRMTAIFEKILPQASLYFASDIEGAVKSAAHDGACITAILGTGSNSCLWTGNEIVGDTFSLGYILGDEGSGSYFGKRLLRDYFYGLLPQDLAHDFKATYPLTRDELIQKVYREPAPNEFIASFLPFYKKHIDHKYCNYFMFYGLEEFIKIYIWRFKDYQQLPVHFVGSMAFHFEQELRTICKSLQVTVGTIIQAPIFGLLNYHKQQLS